jgi:gliding motility-associated protein GldM
MINLMYLVFIGMLALNVSTEVLDGFELVEESLLRSVVVSTDRNSRIFSGLTEAYEANHEKTQEWYDKGMQVKTQSDTLFNYIQDLKERVVRKADGKNSDPEHLKHPDDLNAAYDIMFEQGRNDASKLKSDIDAYRQFITPMVSDLSIKNIIESNLSTEPSAKAKANKQTWEESMFWQMPVAAAVTLLTKMQKDVRDAEGAVLGDLIKNIDLNDYRVNVIEAYIIPETQNVMRGGAYRATIGLFAQDSTQRPRIFVNGRLLPDEANGHYTAAAGSTGTFQVNGYIEMPQGDGSFVKRDFSTQYYVVEPSATVAPVLMNVLYAGISNDIRIAVPGVASQNVSASISNGTLTAKGNGIWTANPRYGSDAVITVTARMSDGRTQEMARTTFRVRQLPLPTAYMLITDPDGNKVRYKGGVPGVPKAALVAVDALSAAIDDGILDINFTVLRFNLVQLDAMGYRMTTPSSGATFTSQQKDVIRGLQRGRSILVSDIVVRGPDGIERMLNAPMELRIN